jgi:hypothetical protein
MNIAASGTATVYLDDTVQSCTTSTSFAGGIPYANYTLAYFGTSTQTTNAAIAMTLYSFQMYYSILSAAAITSISTNTTCANPAVTFTTNFTLNYIGKDFLTSSPAFFGGQILDFQVYNLDMYKGTDSCAPNPPPMPPLPPMPPPLPPAPPPPPFPTAAPSTSPIVSFELMIHNITFPSFGWQQRSLASQAIQTVLPTATFVSITTVVNGPSDVSNYETVIVGVVLTMSNTTLIPIAFPMISPAPNSTIALFSSLKATDVTLMGGISTQTSITNTFPGAAVTLGVTGMAMIEFSIAAQRAFASSVGAFLNASCDVTGVVDAGGVPGLLQVGMTTNTTNLAALLAALPSPAPGGITNLQLINKVNTVGLPKIQSVTLVQAPITISSATPIGPLCITVNVPLVLDYVGIQLIQSQFSSTYGQSFVVTGYSFTPSSTNIGLCFSSHINFPAPAWAGPFAGLPQVANVTLNANSPAEGYTANTASAVANWTTAPYVQGFTVVVTANSPLATNTTASIVSAVARAMGQNTSEAFEQFSVAQGANSSQLQIGIGTTISSPANVSLAYVQAAGLPQVTSIVLLGPASSSALFSAPSTSGSSLTLDVTAGVILPGLGQRLFAAAAASAYGVSSSAVQITYVSGNTIGYVIPNIMNIVSYIEALLTSIQKTGMPNVAVLNYTKSGLYFSPTTTAAAAGFRTAAIFTAAGAPSTTAAQTSAVIAAISSVLDSTSTYTVSVLPTASGVSFGLNFPASIAVSSFNFENATAIVQAGGYPQITNISLVKYSTNIVQKAMSTTVNSFVTVAMNTQNDFAKQQSLLVALATALNTPGCCEVIDTYSNETTTVAVSGISSSEVKLTNFSAAYVNAGFLTTADPVITDAKDYVPVAAGTYGVITTVHLSGLVASTLQQSALQAQICIFATLSEGCVEVSGVNFTSSETNIGLFFLAANESNALTVNGLAKTALDAPNLLASLQKTGFSALTAISAEPLSYVTPVTLPSTTYATSFTIDISTSIGNKESGSLLAAMSKVFAVPSTSVVLNGINNASLGVSVSTQNLETAVAVSTQVTTRGEVLTAIQQTGLPQFQNVTLGTPLISNIEPWKQPATPYGYIPLKINGISSITNATVVVVLGAVSQAARILLPCVFLADTAPPDIIGVAINAPCVITNAERFAVIANLSEPTMLSAIFAAIVAGGLPQVTSVTLGQVRSPCVLSDED